MLKKLLALLMVFGLSVSAVIADPVYLDGSADDQEYTGVADPEPDYEEPPPPVYIENENAKPQLLRNPDGSNPYAPQQYNSLHTTPPPPLP